MKLSSQTQSKLDSKTDLIIIPILSTKGLDKLSLFDNSSKKLVNELIKSKALSAKKGSEYSIYIQANQRLTRCMFFGMEKKKGAPGYIEYRELSGSITQAAIQNKSKCVQVIASECQWADLEANQLGQCIAEGMQMGAYEFTEFKTEKSKKANITINWVVSQLKPSSLAAFQKGSKTGQVVGDAVNEARDLANRPANILNPESFEAYAKKTFKGSNIKVTVISAAKAQKMGMNALLGVGKGSQYPSRLLCLEYQGKTKAPICLVGKGVTFDSGGISIKPSKGMSSMKADMSGAAAVFGAMLGLSKLKPKDSVLGLIPVAENMPSSTALKPGDIITAMNGKSIEILNTDAEGRLILADAICYAVSKKARCIIDVATLTGACLVALGEMATAILTNEQAMVDEMKNVAEFSGERVWQLPLYEEYLDYLKSDYADIANCSEGRYGGTCSAAKFLEQFTDDIAWLHMDIASMMSNNSSKQHHIKGMSGVGVQNLIGFVLNAKVPKKS